MVIIGRITPPNVGLAFSSENVRLKIGQEIVGNGNLYITQNSLVWRPGNMDQDGISIFWKQISVHGISTTPSNCIYFMLDHQLKWPGIYEGDNPHNLSNGAADTLQGGGSDNDEGGDGASDKEEDDEENDIYEDAEDLQMTECWLIPEDPSTVNAMYQAMSDCQSLHPDSGDSLSGDSEYMDDDGDNGEDAFGLGGSGEGGDDEIASMEQARDNMNNMSLNDNRFADADE